MIFDFFKFKIKFVDFVLFVIVVCVCVLNERRMEPAKIEKFFEIIFLYKGRYPIRRTHHNEEYREEKIYNFWLEFDEKLTWIWLSMQRVYYSFLCQSSKSMEITFGI